MEKALVVIDVQVGVIGGAHDEEGVLERIRGLQAKARAAGVPVIHVQHADPEGLGSPLERGTAAWQLHPAVGPVDAEPVVHKPHCDSFHETDLKQVLEARGIRSLVVAGCMTDYCIDTTCRRAVTLGYDVTLVKDAHSTQGNGVLTAEQIIAHHNRTLTGLGVTLTSAAEVEF